MEMFEWLNSISSFFDAVISTSHIFRSKKTTLKLPPFVAIPGVFLSESWGFSATLHEHLGFIDSGNHQISSWKSGHSGDGVLVHHLWWGTKTLVNGVTKHAAGSRKVAQRNFELEGRDFRRWIGVADIKQKHTKLLWQAYHVWSTYPSFNSVETSVKPFGGCCGIPGLQSASLQDTLH